MLYVELVSLELFVETTFVWTSHPARESASDPLVEGSWPMEEGCADESDSSRTVPWEPWELLLVKSGSRVGRDFKTGAVKTFIGRSSIYNIAQ